MASKVGRGRTLCSDQSVRWGTKNYLSKVSMRNVTWRWLFDVFAGHSVSTGFDNHQTFGLIKFYIFRSGLGTTLLEVLKKPDQNK